VERHLVGSLVALEEAFGAGGEDAEVPSGGEQRVDDRVLAGDHLHEQVVVDHHRGRQPVVGVEEAHPHLVAVVPVRQLADDPFDVGPVHTAAHEPTEFHRESEATATDKWSRRGERKSITVVRIVYDTASQFLPMDFDLPAEMIIREYYYTLTAI